MLRSVCAVAQCGALWVAFTCTLVSAAESRFDGTLHFNRLSLDDGLSQSVVTAIVVVTPELTVAQACRHDPGVYAFRVKGSDNDGVWNHDGVFLPLVVQPAVWQAWWFRPTVSMVVLLAVGAAYPRRAGRITRRSQRLERVDAHSLPSNAINSTHSGGSVTRRCEPVDGHMVDHVEDTGQGLSAADLEEVFSEFGTLSARPTGGETSTGLGLAIVDKLVRLHGGRVWVESVLGKGTVFSFSLPLESAAA